MMIPSLGTTKQEIYRNWKRALPGPGQIVVGLIIGEGVFSWSRDRLVKHERANCGVAVFRPTTNEEQKMVDKALGLGRLQIQAQPVTGVIGGQGGLGTTAQSACSVYVLHQATGREVTK